MDTATTRNQLVAHAQRLIQERGYNGFSYRDLAALVGIKTASIHYHFPQKEDLLLAAVEAYQAQWRAAIRTIPPDLPANAKLQQYVALHKTTFGGTDRVCLGGALAADLGSLPDPVRPALQAFYRANEEWLADVLIQGGRDGSLPQQADPQAGARAFFAALQGSLCSSRLFGNSERVRDILPAPTKPDSPGRHAEGETVSA